MKDIQTKDNNLQFAGVDVCDIATKYGTPLYMYDQNMIEENIETVNNSFLMKYPNTKAYYAAKAFLTMKMAKIIASSSLGIDVASMGECYIAMKAGIDPSRILFHGNNKSYDELEYSIKNGIGRIVIDSLRELDDLIEITTRLERSVRILVRFSPKLNKIETHKNIQTGHKASKFGVNLDSHIDEIADRVRNSIYIDFAGFHFHVGSQLKTNRHHLEAISEIFPHIQYLKDNYGIVCNEIDIGGGYGIAYVKGDEALPLSKFVDDAMLKIQTLCIKSNIPMMSVAIEPGRSIVGTTAITLYQVGTVKKTPQHSLIAINGGMTDNLRVALYQATYEAVVANKADLAASDTYTIVGNACESTDIMIKNIQLPKTETGDILAVLNTGAYEHSLSNNFNKMLRPCVLMVHNKKVEIIQRREILEDLLRRDE